MTDAPRRAVWRIVTDKFSLLMHRETFLQAAEKAAEIAAARGVSLVGVFQVDPAPHRRLLMDHENKRLESRGATVGIEAGAS